MFSLCQSKRDVLLCSETAAAWVTGAEGISLSALMVIYAPGSGVYRKSAELVGDESAEAAFGEVTSGRGLETSLLYAVMPSDVLRRMLWCTLLVGMGQNHAHGGCIHSVAHLWGCEYRPRRRENGEKYNIGLCIVSGSTQSKRKGFSSPWRSWGYTSSVQYLGGGLGPACTVPAWHRAMLRPWHHEHSISIFKISL